MKTVLDPIYQEPTLPGLLKTLRHMEEVRRRANRGLSPLSPRSRRFPQQLAAGEAGLSVSYLARLETDPSERPTLEVLRALARVYRASDDQWQHLCDLADHLRTAIPSTLYPAETSARRGVEITDSMWRQLAEPTDEVRGYYDLEWNLLAANKAHLAALPGCTPGANLIQWMFSASARSVIAHWHRQAAQTAAMWRGVLAQHRHEPWARRLHQRLANNPDFRALWSKGEVCFWSGHEITVLVRHGGRELPFNVEYSVHANRVYNLRGARPSSPAGQPCSPLAAAG